MIKPKKGTCIDCPPSTLDRYIYAQKRCEYHYWIWRNGQKQGTSEKKFEQKSLVNQNSNLNSEISLTPWFDFHVSEPVSACENCSSQLLYFSIDMAYSCQAHILPKSLFPSVKMHLTNHLYLCGMFHKNHCHADFDSSWSKAEKMPVFEIAVSRFILFKESIAESEYKKLRKTPFYEYL